MPRQAAITLAMLLTRDQLLEMKRKGWRWRNRGRGRPGVSNVASPQPAARHGEPAQVSPANAAAPDGRAAEGWRDLLEWNRAVRGQFTIRRFHGPDLAGRRLTPLWFNTA
jgi:hypothetical protein